MKIALISQNAYPALPIFRKNLILDLVALGHEVYCLANDYTDQTKQQVSQLGAQPVPYKLSRSGLNPFIDFLNTIKLYKLLKELNIDVMLSFFAKPVIYGSIASKLAKVPVRVGMLEGLGYAFTEQPYKTPIKTRLLKNIQIFLYRISIPLLDSIIVLNPDDKNDLLIKNNIKAKRIFVLGGIGLDLNEYKYSKPDINKHRYIFIGRLLAEKGINEFIEAAKNIKLRYPKTEFLVLGGFDNDNPGKLKREEFYKLIDNNIINYLGQVDNVTEWIQNSSVFVLPSYREGIPRSTQEAMAIGRAVITTDVPGCRETVQDGINGFLIPKWNINALTDAMSKFIETPELIETMGLESYRIAKEKFDVKKINAKLIEILGV